MKQISKGKVRDIYDVGGEKLVIVTSDGISAFDTVLPTHIPFKGIVLNKMSAFWFHYSEGLIPNHMISINDADMPKDCRGEKYKGRCMLVRKVKMLPVECVVRGYLYGTAWDSYKKTGYVSDKKLPDGLQLAEKLGSPICNFVTKENGIHNLLSEYDAINLLGGDIDLATQIELSSKMLYSLCAEYAASRGIFIADTKFQFGIDSKGKLVLAGEVLTPDSSRFWLADQYVCGKTQKSYDKQIIVDWLLENNWHVGEKAPILPEFIVDETTDKYLDAYKMLTGKYCLDL